MGFTANGYRVAEPTFTKDNIVTLRNHWIDYVNTINDYPTAKYKGKGIVFTAGGLKYITCLWISINRIRSLQCNLPIEVWFAGNEISPDIIEKFKPLNVELKNFHDLTGNGTFSAAGFALKPLSIIHSSFEEVLFLDSDNVPMADPGNLFLAEGYLKNGAMFWPDYWKTEPINPIWEIIGVEPDEGPEQESGQLLVNKKICWPELQLCNYFNKHGRYYYQMLYGDKDTFKFSWMALKKSYHMVKTDPGACGTIVDDAFFGNTIVQYDDEGQVAFMHRNLLKWDITGCNERAWLYTKRFIPAAVKKNYEFKSSATLNSLDLQGDVATEKCSAEICELESYCLTALNDWRNSLAFCEYLKYCYIQQNRFRDKATFDLNSYFQSYGS